jgi:hypothetical protein
LQNNKKYEQVKLAIMQPYIFPYIGYFQLINAVDKFVILDDVNYINKGWINRNKILSNGSEHLFTIPLKEASQNRLINEIELSDDSKWAGKFLKTIQFNYKRAPFFETVFPVIERIILNSEKSLSLFIYDSIIKINSYLDINTTLILTSALYQNRNLKGQDRILDICIREKASTYINPIGGTKLYSKEMFSENMIELHFLNTKPIKYIQFGDEFVHLLSIIDLMMFNSKEKIQFFIGQYELL